MSASWKDFQPKAKKEDATPTSTTAIPAAITSTRSTHSQGLSAFLTQLSSAYSSNDPRNIHSAQFSLIGALHAEKKIEKERVEVKKDNEFAELFDKTLDVKENGKDGSEMETDVEGSGKNGKKENCCGCGGCDKA